MNQREKGSRMPGAGTEDFLHQDTLTGVRCSRQAYGQLTHLFIIFFNE
jgi:hypothetical protein